ncbi:hypothetical protein MASR2M48_33460 [Spirochaetota bacterium]
MYVEQRAPYSFGLESGVRWAVAGFTGESFLVSAGKIVDMHAYLAATDYRFDAPIYSL